jgi:hypothetical protein
LGQVIKGFDADRERPLTVTLVLVAAARAGRWSGQWTVIVATERVSRRQRPAVEAGRGRLSRGVQGEALCAEAARQLSPELGGTLHYERLETDEPILVVEERTIELGEELEHLIPALVVAALGGTLGVAAKDAAESVHKSLVGLGVEQELLDFGGTVEKGEKDAVICDGVDVDGGVEARGGGVGCGTQAGKGRGEAWRVRGGCRWFGCALLLVDGCTSIDGMVGVAFEDGERTGAAKEASHAAGWRQGCVEAEIGGCERRSTFHDGLLGVVSSRNC